MGYSTKEKMNLARSEAVARLHSLAEQLERGTIQLGDRTFQVPDHVRIKIKAEKDELEIELKWTPSAA